MMIKFIIAIVVVTGIGIWFLTRNQKSSRNSRRQYLFQNRSPGNCLRSWRNESGRR